MADKNDKNKNELHDGDVNDEIVETGDELDEKTDPKGGKPSGKEGITTEPESVSSVDKAEKSTKKTSLPNGGKGQGSKTKAGMINTMYKTMSGMKKEELEVMYSKVMGEELSEDADDTQVEAPDTQAELSKLVEDEATLSEDFKAKASILFETALNARIAEETERLDEEYKEKLETAIKEHTETLSSQVDSYLNYVVENWMKENEVAIQNGLRTEIAEDFMKKLHGLFEESYINVPDGKVDLVDELAEDNKDLESKLNEATEELISKTGEIEELKKEKIINEACKDLAATQVEKVSKLLESADFEDEESFKSKVETVKESYFKKSDTKNKAGVITEDVDDDSEDDDETVSKDPKMAQYVQTLQRISPKKV